MAVYYLSKSQLLLFTIYQHRSAAASFLMYCAIRLREYILCCMRRTAILKNNCTAEKRREEEAFAIASIAHYCLVKTKSHCGQNPPKLLKNSQKNLLLSLLCIVSQIFVLYM